MPRKLQDYDLIPAQVTTYRLGELAVCLGQDLVHMHHCGAAAHPYADSALEAIQSIRDYLDQIEAAVTAHSPDAVAEYRQRKAA